MLKLAGLQEGKTGKLSGAKLLGAASTDRENHEKLHFFKVLTEILAVPCLNKSKRFIFCF